MVGTFRRIACVFASLVLLNEISEPALAHQPDRAKKPEGIDLAKSTFTPEHQKALNCRDAAHSTVLSRLLELMFADADIFVGVAVGARAAEIGMRTESIEAALEAAGIDDQTSLLQILEAYAVRRSLDIDVPAILEEGGLTDDDTLLDALVGDDRTSIVNLSFFEQLAEASSDHERSNAYARLKAELSDGNLDKLDKLRTAFALWAYEVGYLGHYPFAVRVRSGSGFCRIAQDSWGNSREFFDRWLQAKYFADEFIKLNEKPDENRKKIDKLRYRYNRFTNPSDGSVDDHLNQCIGFGPASPEFAQPLDLMSKLVSGEIELFCPDREPLAVGLDKVANKIAYRLTPEDLVKNPKNAKGGKISWSRTTKFEERSDETTGETEVVRKVDDKYNFEATLGIEPIGPSFLKTKAAYFYIRYNHTDNDTRFDDINEANAKCREENAEVEPFKSNPKLCDADKTRVLTLGYVAKYAFDQFDLTPNFGFSFDVHNNAETARFRNTVDLKKAIHPCQDKSILKGLTFSCEPSLIGEAAWIIDAGDNRELLDLQKALDDPDGDVIDDSGQYFGIGGKILGRLKFLKRFTLEGSYRYLAVPGGRVADQNLFQASLNLSLDEKERWSLELKRTNGDDIDDFSNKNKWEVSVTSKF